MIKITDLNDNTVYINPAYIVKIIKNKFDNIHSIVMHDSTSIQTKDNITHPLPISNHNNEETNNE